MDSDHFHKRTQEYLDSAIHDLRILSGDIVGPSNASWQVVAGTAVVHLQLLADYIAHARNGDVNGPIVFPEVEVPSEDR